LPLPELNDLLPPPPALRLTELELWLLPKLELCDELECEE